MKTKSKVAAIIAVLLLMVIVSIIWKNEYAPYYDRDLQYIRPNVPDSDNGYGHLDNACRALYLPKNLEGKLESLIGIPSFSVANASPTNANASNSKETNVAWDPEAVQDLLSSNQVAFQWLSKALASTSLMVPEPRTLNEDFPYLKDFRMIARIMILQAKADFLADQHQKALDQLFKTVQFGDKVQTCGGCFFHCMVGRAIKNSALSHLRWMACSTNLTEIQLRDLSYRLNTLSVNRLGFSNSIKMEYQLCLKTIHNLRNGNGIPGDSMPRIMGALGAKLMIREGKTRQILADKFRWILQHSESHYCDIPMQQLNPPPMNVQNGARMVFQGNIVGEVLTQVLGWTSYNPGLIDEDVILTGTKLAVALAYYRKKNGAFPKSLTELVPGYLKAVPIDHFNGKPFRYMPEKKIVYSVGRDLQDDKGLVTQRNGHKRDIVFPLDFPKIPE